LDVAFGVSPLLLSSAADAASLALGDLLARAKLDDDAYDSD